MARMRGEQIAKQSFYQVQKSTRNSVCPYLSKGNSMLACSSPFPMRTECVRKKVSYKGEKGVGFHTSRRGYGMRVTPRRLSGRGTRHRIQRLCLQQVGLGGDEFIHSFSLQQILIFTLLLPGLKLFSGFLLHQSVKQLSLPGSHGCMMQSLPTSSASSYTVSPFSSSIQAHRFPF